MPEGVLVVDDETVLRQNLVRFLRAKGHDVDEAPDGLAALETLRRRPRAVVLTDLRMPGLDGTQLLEQIVREWPETMVIVATAYASIESALAALRSGAQDYLIKPLILEDVARRIENLLSYREMELRVRRLRQEVTADYDTRRIVGRSKAWMEVMELVGRAGPTASVVLLQGETGTGKELVARAIHDASPVAAREFVGVNLAAVPPDLVDATLFGHERGSFTGAHQRREGVIRSARGGSVFLDEVGELPLPVQAKLLRVIENREVHPVGMDRPLGVDFRLIAATNKDLHKAAEGGTFRQDLLYRLDVFGIRLPPLRERHDDVPELAAHFLARHSKATCKRVTGFKNDALQRLLAYGWPGNVRELSNVVERAVLLTDDEWIGARDLPGELRDIEPAPVELRPALERFRAQHIARVLGETGGDKEEAARLLGVHLATLYRYLESDRTPAVAGG